MPNSKTFCKYLFYSKPPISCPSYFLPLRRPIAAITKSDVLREVVCRPINMTLLHSLQYGRRFSSRPLVHYENSRGNSTIGQIYLEGNVYPGLQFVEKHIPGRVFTFRVANHFYTFQNYSLTHARSNVYRLPPNSEANTPE